MIKQCSEDWKYVEPISVCKPKNLITLLKSQKYVWFQKLAFIQIIIWVWVEWILNNFENTTLLGTCLIKWDSTNRLQQSKPVSNTCKRYRHMLNNWQSLIWFQQWFLTDFLTWTVSTQACSGLPPYNLF